MRAVPTTATWSPSTFTSPPWPALPFASTSPATTVVPLDTTSMLPPLGPFAVVVLPASSVASLTARKTILPFSPTTALFALTVPRLAAMLP
jgi:hypothetical protein